MVLSRRVFYATRATVLLAAAFLPLLAPAARRWCKVVSLASPFRHAAVKVEKFTNGSARYIKPCPDLLWLG